MTVASMVTLISFDQPVPSVQKIGAPPGNLVVGRADPLPPAHRVDSDTGLVGWYTETREIVGTELCPGR
jgi:hypothetical protein